MELVLRATVVFFFLWCVTRALGKRGLAEMSAFELVLLVTVGDMVQQGVTQEDRSVTGAFLAVGTIVFWVLVIGYVAYRFPRSRRVIDGEPLLVVRHGRPLRDAMRAERVTMDDLREAAREQGIADLADVEAGVLDPDGRFSFLTAGAGRHESEKSKTP